jgi:hypothetical protein
VMSGGGGSSGSTGGGGGGSGAISYPTYMQDWHTTWLANVATAMTTAQATSPYTGLSAYNPSVALSVVDAAVSVFRSEAILIDSHTTFDTIAGQAGDEADDMFAASVFASMASRVDTYITTSSAASTATSAFSDMLDEEYDGKITPAFEAGMRDINAIMSSAFVIGTSLIATERANKVAKFTSEILLQDHNKRGDYIMSLMTKRSDLITQAISEMLRLFIQKIEFTRTYAALISDTKRIHIAAMNDQQLEDKAIDVNDAKWDLETFQYGANMLAAIGGGTAQPPKMEGSQMARIIGGGLSGAAAGAMLGSRIGGEGSSLGGWGALIGGIGGMIAGA